MFSIPKRRKCKKYSLGAGSVIVHEEMRNLASLNAAAEPNLSTPPSTCTVFLFKSHFQNIQEEYMQCCVTKYCMSRHLIV